jgi:Zn-dependent peptidase ImmA (M78 family)
VGDTENHRESRKSFQVHDYPLWKLEQVAEDVLKDAKFCIQNYHVDIEKLIEHKYGIIIDIHYNLQLKSGVMAYMLTQGNRLFIDDKLIDNPRNAKRYRFTLAEELAHFIIHKDVYKDCKTINERLERESLLTRQEQWFLETNAKALASAILMPKFIIEERINNLFSTIGNSAGHTYSIIAILSHDFDVNPRAVRRRLINLGYHKRSNLKLKEE